MSFLKNKSGGNNDTVRNEGPNIKPLLERMFMFLEDGLWERADQYSERILDIDPKCAQAYLGKLMVDMQVRRPEWLQNQPQIFEGNHNYQKIMRFGDELLKKEMLDCTAAIRNRNNTVVISQNSLANPENTRKEEILAAAKAKMNNSDYTAALNLLLSIPGWNNSDELQAVCRSKIEESKKKRGRFVIAAIILGIAICVVSVVLLVWKSTDIPEESREDQDILTESGNNIAASESVYTEDEGVVTEVVAETASSAVWIVENFNATVTEEHTIEIFWECEKGVPAGGWVLTYNISGLEQTVEVSENAHILNTIIPGAEYVFSLHSKLGEEVVVSDATLRTPDAALYSNNYGGIHFSAENITLEMCVRPDEENWFENAVEQTTVFNTGDCAGFITKANQFYNETERADIDILYVIRDENGNIIRYDNQIRIWRDLFECYSGYLTVPALPDAPGTYTMDIYYNSQFVHSQHFEMVE